MSMKVIIKKKKVQKKPAQKLKVRKLYHSQHRNELPAIDIIENKATCNDDGTINEIKISSVNNLGANLLLQLLDDDIEMTKAEKYILRKLLDGFYNCHYQLYNQIRKLLKTKGNKYKDIISAHEITNEAK